MTAELTQWRPGDAEALLDIYGRIFGKEKAAAKRASWTWQYADIPQPAQSPAIWVARRDGIVVGQIGAMPVSLWWGTREVRASWGIDYFVTPEAEGLGDSIALLKAWMTSVDVALAFGLAPASYLICKRFGFRDLGHVPLFQAVLDPAAIVQRRWGRFARTVAAPALTPARLFIRRRYTRAIAGVEVSPANNIGEEYDVLWERARRGFAMCVRRDGAYVRWRYQAAPHKRYTVLEARRNGVLTGFLVSRHEDYRGLRLGWIVDVFACADDRRTREALLSNAMDGFFEAGVARVQAFCTNRGLAADLRRRGFFKAASPAHLVVRVNGVAESAGQSVNDWHVVFGDADADR
ncbi:MAG TPA: GNAT family N-acetyltransferase [Vicinamibacterales bacterium]